MLSFERFTRLLLASALSGLACTRAVPPEGVWRPQPGERTDRIPGPINIKDFGPFDSFSRALDATCSLVLSKPHAAAQQHEILDPEGIAMSSFRSSFRRVSATALRGLLLAAVLSACWRSPCPSPVSRGDDRSIVFPQFFEQEAIQIGADERPYELDGAMLRALMVATNDFLPADGQRPPCRSGQGLKYRVIRQGEIIFVSLSEDLSACGVAYAVADSGAKYAVSMDGRILRRVVDGQPMEPESRDTPDAGHHPVPADFGTSAVFDGGVSPDGDGGPQGAP